MFNALCRGEKLRPATLESHLKCFNIHYNDPYFKLGPFKVEQHNSKPFVSVFHDFMSDSEIKFWLKFANKKGLFRSGHADKTGNPMVTSIKRTSAQNWLHYLSEKNGTVTHPTAAKVSQRIVMATRLYTDEAIMPGEPFQVKYNVNQLILFTFTFPIKVANYGIGGVYSFHLDGKGEGAIEVGSDDVYGQLGDRMATSMIYLSDVQAGGATAFPNLGITVWPKRGNMVFW